MIPWETENDTRFESLKWEWKIGNNMHHSTMEQFVESFSKTLLYNG